MSVNGLNDDCPVCKVGKMVSIGGCTQCSMNCGFVGSCDR